MRITKVTITPSINPGFRSRLLAFADIELDGALVIHGIKIIGTKEGVMIAMPQRERTESCQRCKGRNALSAVYCSRCGDRLSDPGFAPRSETHKDVVHPINRTLREQIEYEVFAAWDASPAEVVV